MDRYEDILDRMKNKYTELSGRQIPPLSDIDIRMKVLAGEIYNDEVNLDFIKRQMFPSTATGNYLDFHAADRGMARKPAVKSEGELRFSISNPISENINIPAGTVASTSGQDPVRFVTTENAVLTAGNTLVSVYAEAVDGGSAGNIARESVDTMVTAVIGIESVTNPSIFTGGSDRETDEELRRRILASYITVSNGTNKEYYRKLAVSVDGVGSASVVPRTRGNGTVDVYICGEGIRATGALVSRVQSIMDVQRELNVDVRVFAASLLTTSFGVSVVLKDGYDIDTVADNIRASVREYISSLEVGEDVYESHLGRAVLAAEGVYNYEWINNYPSQYTVSNDTVAVYGSVRVEEASA